MNIFIDDEAFIIQRFGGVSRIFAEIIKRLRLENSCNLFFCNFYSENEYLIKLKLNGFYPVLVNYNFPLKGKFVRFISRAISRPWFLFQLKKEKRGVLHSSFYSDYYLNLFKRNKSLKLVFTVHDLIHELMPDVPGNKRLISIKQKNLLCADHIIVVSESTKKDLLRFYPFVQENKVSVIHLANSLPEKSCKMNIPKKFVLYVGERKGYKNFEMFVSAFSKLSNLFADIELVCSGSFSFTKDEINRLKVLNIENKVHHYKCSDEQLKYLYENALFFVFPSHYEGFGIPVLEAFASKVPVILSNKSSLPEVGSNAALYFDPNNEDELLDKMVLLYTDIALRNRLVNLGTERLKDFSWDKHYQLTLSIYQNLNSV